MTSPRRDRARSLRQDEPDGLICLSDKVRLEDNRAGTVKFIGEVEGKEQQFYGIELVKGKGSNDGSIRNKKYFPCRRGRGVFVGRGRIAGSKIQDGNAPRVTVGSRVNVSDKGKGTVKYVGYPAFKQHDRAYIGVELDEPNGRSDGTVRGEFYCTSSAARVVFVPVPATPSRYTIDPPPRNDSQETEEVENVVETRIGPEATQQQERMAEAVDVEELKAEIEQLHRDELVETPELPAIPLDDTFSDDGVVPVTPVSVAPGIHREFSVMSTDLDDMLECVLAMPHVQQACIVFVAHPSYTRRPVVMAVLDTEESLSYGKLFRHLRKGFDCFLPDDLVVVPSLPLLEDGDIDRQAALEQLVGSGYVHPTLRK